MNLKNSKIIISRKYRGLDGGLRNISIPAERWMILDWLVDEYGFPVAELIGDAEEHKDEDFNEVFATFVRFSYDAMIMTRDGLANDNFLEPI